VLDQSIPNRSSTGILCALALIVLLAGGISSAGASTTPPGFQDTAVISGLTSPTSVRFSPDGRVFVAEKSGLIKVFDSLSDTTPTTFADLRSQVFDYWDRGLLGLALHPNFPAQPFVYALYSYDAPIGGTAPVWGDNCPNPPGPNTDGCVGGGRLSKLTASGNVMAGSEQVLIEDWCIQFPSHSIGDLEFGPDGALYVSGGDGASFTFRDYGQAGNPKNPCGDPPAGVGGTQTPPTAEGGSLRSQDLRTSSDPTTLDGTILRLDPNTGAAMAGNPLAASGDPNARRIVAYGFRNPFRFTLRPGTGEIWVGDVGQGAWEEIDRIQDPITAPVENLGWPCYEGPDRQGGFDGANLNLCEALYGQSGAVNLPYFAYSQESDVVQGENCPRLDGSAISGLTFYGGGAYPDSYDGALFFADYSRNCIWAMATNGGQLPNPGSVLTFAAQAETPVDLEVGPGGDVYYVDIAGGQIRRIHYQASNLPPTARATASPTSGPAPLTVSFDATGSTDPENDPLSFAWDLDDDGSFDDSTSATPQRTYAVIGNHTATVRVRDPSGGTSFDSVTVTAGGSPPTATIDSPLPSFTWKVGDLIRFSGSASDDQDGVLDGSNFSWVIDLHHCTTGCHVHTLRQIDGVQGSEISAPDHDFPSYITIRLTVTDSDGLTDTEEVRIDPQTAQLTLNAMPPGLTLGLDSSSAAAPFTRTVIVGSRHSVSATTPQTLNGTVYSFSQWSDGGAQSHDVTVGSSQALTALYQASASIGEAQTPAVTTGLSYHAFPPDTVIRRGPQGRTRDRTPTFSFAAAPREAGAGFICSLDNRRWWGCSSPQTLRRLGPGAHVFRVRSVGPDGTEDPSAAARHFLVPRNRAAARSSSLRLLLRPPRPPRWASHR
jgi:glucose/arabinose dehydrogenase